MLISQETTTAATIRSFILHSECPGKDHSGQDHNMSKPIKVKRSISGKVKIISGMSFVGTDGQNCCGQDLS